MSGYIAFVKKEFTENTRGYKFLIMVSVFIVLGMFSVLSARFMPEIIAAFAPQLEITLNEPSALDAWEQFYGNVSQLGMSLMLIIFCSCLSGEYVKGTLVNMFTKGLPRPAVILSKFTVAVAIMTVSYWLCFGVTYYYTAYLWAGVALPYTVFAAFSLWLFGIMHLSILMLGCVLFRQGFVSLIFYLVVQVSIGFIGMIKPLEKYSPFALTSNNLDLLSGAASVSEFIMPIISVLVISAGFLLTSILLFEKKQV